MLGIIGTALAGAAQGGGETVARFLTASALQEAAERAQAKREATMLRLREEGDIRVEERKRAPYLQAAESANAAISGAVRLDEDVSGNVTRTEPSSIEQSRLRAKAYHDAGLPDVGVKYDTLAATEQNNVDTKAWRDRQADIQEDRWNKSFDLQLKRISASLNRQGAPKEVSTALTTNVKFMVENGIASNPKDAFDKLQTSVRDDPKKSVERLSAILLKSGDRKYRGEGGTKRAIEDARAMTSLIGGDGDLDSGRETSGGGHFKSAEEVRSAFKAGMIDRETALRELRGRFEFE